MSLLFWDMFFSNFVSIGFCLVLCRSLLLFKNFQVSGKRLSNVYGLQFKKLLKFISLKVVPKWTEALETDGVMCKAAKSAANYYIAVLKLELKNMT